MSGGEAVLLPPGAVGSLTRLDALLLVGGEDLAVPNWWSAGTPQPPVDLERDNAEALLVERAQIQGIPTLGICRGAQLVNCVLGGTVASLDRVGIAQHSSKNSAESVAHNVLVAPNTRLASAVNNCANLCVVSRHSTRISGLGAGLFASAWAMDGSIEAVESINWPFLGVLWHAEWSTEDVCADLSLFQWLVREAKERMLK